MRGCSGTTTVSPVDAIRAIADPRVGVVTLYHGPTDPKRLMALWRHQNPAQMKALVDRCICLCKVPEGEDPVYLLEGKHLALVSTAAGPVEGNMDLLSRVFDGMAEYMHFKNAGELLVPLCSTPTNLGNDVEEKARAFAHTIADTIRPPV